MANPSVRGGIYQLRMRVPADVAKAAAGTFVAIPVGDSSKHVKVTTHVSCSLETRDPSAGRIRHAEAMAAVERHWETLRRDVVELTHKQCLALAGDLRRTFVDILDAEPGSPEMWARVEKLDNNARLGIKNDLMVAANDQRTVQEALETRFGGLVDALLTRQGLRTSLTSRRKLIGHVANAMAEAVAVTKSKAEGDYSDSGATSKYPVLSEAFVAPAQKTTATQMVSAVPSAIAPPEGTSLTRILDKRIEDKARGKDAKPMREDTVRKLRIVIEEFDRFRKDSSTATITPEAVDCWKVSMLDAGDLTNNTVKQRLQNLSTIIGYGIKQSYGKLFPDGNPAKLVERPEANRTPSEEKTFKISEARQVLRATRDKSISDETRWLPWICAYSGARVSEPAQLTVDDVFEVEGRWFLRLTTMGGRSLKNSHSERRVPLHPDVISEGFLDFVASKRAEGTGTSLFEPAKGQSRVRDWVRRTLKITRPELQPNHGWRHLFEDLAMSSGMADSAKTYITGRSTGKSSEGYGKSEAMLAGLAAQMDLIPSFLNGR